MFIPKPNKHTIKFQIIDFYTQNMEFKNEDNDSDSDFSEEDNKFQLDSSEYKIMIFGKDEKGYTYSVLVDDFTPYFYLKVPDNFTKDKIIYLEDWIKQNMWKKYEEALLRITFHKKMSFRGFTNKKKFNFVRLVFQNTNAMNNCINLFQNKTWNPTLKKITKILPKKITILGITQEQYYFDLYENMIDPMIRFIHHREIKPVGWITIPKNKYTIREFEHPTHCNININTRWTNINFNENENNVGIKIMAYDIECDSSHGDFPLPIKDYLKLTREIVMEYERIQKIIINKDSNNIEKLKTLISNKKLFVKKLINFALNEGSEKFNISKVYIKLGFNKPTENTIDIVSSKISKVLIEYDSTIKTLDRNKLIDKSIENINEKILNKNFPPLEGDKTIQIGISFIEYGSTSPYKNIMYTLGTCDNIENTKVVTFSNETDLLLAFNKLIIQEDPEIITGYNINGFDTPWLMKRAQELNIEEDFCKLSRLEDYKCILKERQEKSGIGQLIKVEFVDIPGRIQLDILKLVQKGYNLDSYKLDSVSANFIQGDVKEVLRIDDKTIIKTNNLKGLNKSNFIIFVEQDGYLENKYLDGKKFEIQNISENSFIINENIELDSKKKCIWCLGKDDVSPQDIFRLQKGSSYDRYIIAKYCMMDVILCIELLLKLELLTNSIGMSNVCLIPLNWSIHRGQGVKLLSLVTEVLRKENYLLPYLYKSLISKEGYEGAIVLPPYPGIYLNDPVAVLDYASLYPSSMIMGNLSHETICEDEKWLGDSGIENLRKLGYGYYDVEFDRYQTTFTSSGSIKEKKKIGKSEVRFVQYQNNEKGLIPRTLQHLLNARKTTRKKINYKTVTLKNGQKYSGLKNETEQNTIIIVTEKNDKIEINKDDILDITDTYNKFQQNVLDGLQLAFKITANSLYGQIGARVSDLFYREIAASTTSIGRQQLDIAQTYCENQKHFPKILDNGETIYLNNKCVYGDSVTSDTPLMLYNKLTNNIEFKQIDSIDNSWISYEGFKVGESNRKEKQQIVIDNYMIYTSNGWSNIKRVIRHKTAKKIYRITTHTGCVDVTEDHSLLDKNLNKIKPNDINIGFELLHNYPIFENRQSICLDNILDYIQNIGSYSLEIKKAFIYGFFYGDGSCNKYIYEPPQYSKYSWALNNKDLEYCVILQSLLYEIYGIEFEILDTIDSSNVYKIVPTKSIKKYVEEYRPIFYNKDKYKIIPDYILNADYDTKYAFFAGYYSADGSKCKNEIGKSIRFDNKGKIGTAMFFYLCQSIGLNVSINTRTDKSDIYRLTCSTNKFRKSSIQVKKIDYIQYSNDQQFVYDIETEIGNFNAGIGKLILKNTDSVFVKFDCRYDNGEKMIGKEALAETIKLAKIAEAGIKKILMKPQDLEYEKTFWPFILFTKKRYVGNKYEFDVDKYKQTSMGIVTKRRDNAPICKVIFGGIIDIIMKEKDIKPSIDFLRKNLDNLVNSKFNLDALIISKTLSSFYKDPDRIAHKVLADRMAQRDPGNKPQINDRIPFIYVEIDEKKFKGTILQGDKIENPNYIKQNNLTPNYEFYITNQIMKPVCQIYGLCLEDIPGYIPNIDFNELHIKYEKITDRLSATKKILEKKQRIAGDLLFGEVLRKLQNKRIGNIEISKWFTPVESNTKTIKNRGSKPNITTPNILYYSDDDCNDEYNENYDASGLNI